VKDADLAAFAPGQIVNMSVWINGGGGTILISDTFTIVKG
jgi:hypothetical protein